MSVGRFYNPGTHLTRVSIHGKFKHNPLPVCNPSGEAFIPTRSVCLLVRLLVLMGWGHTSVRMSKMHHLL